MARKRGWAPDPLRFVQAFIVLVVLGVAAYVIAEELLGRR